MVSNGSFESREARLALDFAFSCFRYQSHLEELLVESGFFDASMIPEDLNALVLVMLWEFIQRKFVSRGTRSKAQLGDRIEEVEEVEKSLDKVIFLTPISRRWLNPTLSEF